MCCFDQNAIYQCISTDKTVQDFWKVFFEFSEENKKRFLGESIRI